MTSATETRVGVLELDAVVLG
ncbi:MAG: hypothetical protein QOH17_3654, partial [Pseudonocardiales bacterium]|nr:hypothetical protein [Pseudonocardiales bacterium]